MRWQIFVFVPFLFFSNQDLHTAPKISFNSDIPLSKEEFFYITDLKPTGTITKADLNHAQKQLKIKKRFRSIEVERGKDVHFTLKAHWIFKQAILRGILFGKQQYEDLYLLQPGDLFDIALHEESIINIKQFLFEQGYFAGTVDEELVYDRRLKTISAKIRINRGRHFFINRVTAEGKKLQHFLNSILKNKRYTKELLARAKEKVITILKKHGSLKNKITIKRHVDRATRKVSILFLVTLQQKQTYNFQGNRFFSEEEIKKKLFDEEEPYWMLAPKIIAQKLLYEYYKHGFWQTRIQILSSRKRGDRKKTKFTIHEGVRVKIQEITKSFFFHKLLKQKFYNETFLQDGIEKLKTFYIEHGFWDFSIKKQEFVKTTKPNTYKIILHIKRGTQRFLKTKSGIKPFDPEVIQKKRTEILSRLRDEGYWYANVTANITSTKKSAHTEIITLNWKINKGEKVVFDKIFMRGNTKLPFSKIIKTIPIKIGDVWDRKKLDLAQKKLTDLDIFKYIQVKPKYLASKHHKKPIVITLLDDNPFEVKLRAGYFLTSKNFLLKRESTPKVGGTLLMKNPFNQAGKISFNAEITKFERDIDLDYHVPQPYNFPVNAQAKIYAHKYVHPLELGKSDSAYEALQNGFLLGITKEYNSTNNFGLSIGNEWMTTSRARGNLKLTRNMINNTIPYFFLEPSIVLDQMDDKLKTTRGSLTFLSCKTMIPYANRSTTYKIGIDRSQFFPLPRNVVVAIRLRWGHIFRQAFEEIMPIERFFLGGESSVRGYSKDTVPPLGEGTIQGGSSMINGNAELRFPIYKDFGAVLFCDVGVLSQSGFCGFRKRWHPTSGFGFRYQTPIGALRFDIGWKWKKSFVTDTGYAWYLTLGQVF